MDNGASAAGTLAVKAVKGSAYSIAASAITLVLGLGRSILMARLLSPEDYGVVAFALTLMNLTIPLRSFGLDLALIHRKVDGDAPLGEAMAVHFSLRLVLIAAFVMLLLVTTPVLRYLYPQKNLLIPILFVLAIGEVATALGSTPTVYLRKEMCFRELAILQVLTSLSMTIVGPLMAWQGYGVWAIVGERISGLIAGAFAVWVFFRLWRPRLRLMRDLVRWYWEYGKFVFASQILIPVVDQFDEFWIGTTLGNMPLGLYSKAYEFAQYPHRIVSMPIVGVALPAFAQAQGSRSTLSSSYRRFSGLIARLGFFVTGIFVLVAREFVVLLLGAKWEPMVLTFQVMAVYMLLQPLLSVTANLMVAVGRPKVNMHTLLLQTVFSVPAIIIANAWFQFNGVAVVTDITLVLGLVYMFHQAKAVVDFSPKEMILIPTAAFLIGCGVAWLSGLFIFDDTLRFIGKAVAYMATYNALLLLLERRKYVEQLQILSQILLRHR